MEKSNINWKTDKYKVIGIFPNSEYNIGDIVFDGDNQSEISIEYKKIPNLFKPLKWYEELIEDFNFMFTIKYCKIIDSKGYWQNGTILPVVGYLCETNTKNPYITGFTLKGHSNEEYSIIRVEPSDENEFLKWKEENKILHNIK